MATLEQIRRMVAFAKEHRIKPEPACGPGLLEENRVRHVIGLPLMTPGTLCYTIELQRTRPSA